MNQARLSLARLCVLGVAAVLLVYKLNLWPAPWYDEGITLQAAKALAEEGRYGLSSPDGFHYFDSLITTGPTVVVPIAVMFRVAGVGLLQARVVMVTFAMLTLAVYYLWTSKLFGRWVAALATLQLLVIPTASADTSASFLGLSRMVMGEVPALLFLALGCLVWGQAVDRKRLVLLLVAGLFFGLAILTKLLSGLLVLALLLALVLDHFGQRRLRRHEIVIPILVSLACFCGWWLYQGSVIGWDGIGLGENDSRERLLANALAPLSAPLQLVRNIRALFNSGLVVWGAPGILYAAVRLYKHEPRWQTPGHILLWAMGASWLVWFVLGSVGWLRYGFVGLTVLNLFAAKLLVDIVRGLLAFKSDELPQAPGRQEKRAQGLAMVLAMALMILIPLQQWARGIMTASDTSAVFFARYLEANVPQNAVIETGESEIVFLTDRQFHQPPLEAQVISVRHVQLGEPYPPDFYDFAEFSPSFLVNGPFAKTTQFYDRELQSGRFQRVISIGPYDLYQIADLPK